MTTLTIPQTYAYARQAGFSPAQAVIATAIAMSESGLVVANRCKDCFPGVREDSNGLWQINVNAHPQYDAARLRSDPAYNAKAAFEVSGGGQTFRPWTTYTSGKYLANLSRVRQAIGGADPVATTPFSPSGTASGGTGTASLTAGGTATSSGSSSSTTSSSSSHDWKIALPGLPDLHLDGGAIMRGAMAVGIVVGGLYLAVMGVQRTVAPAVKRTLDSGVSAAGMAAAL